MEYESALNKKIKILSLSTTYPESSDSTKPKFVHLLNKELAKLGAEINVISPHSKGLPEKTEMDSIQINFFKYLPDSLEITKSIPDEAKTIGGKLKILLMLFRFFLFSKSFSHKYTDLILHGHWAFPGGYIAYLIAKRLKKKFIVTVHGSEIAQLKKYSYLRKITVNALNHSSKVIASNNFLKNRLIKLGINENKIELIKPVPNFITTNLKQNELKKFREKFTNQENKIILFVGRLTEVKGTEYLIKSLKLLKIKNFHCIIVGGGILEKKLKELAQTENLSEHITFFGPANSKQLGSLYSIGDVFVLPSIVDSLGGTEGTGLVIPEAMNCNLPVIASNVGGIADIIKHEENGLLVEQKNPEQIANAIDRIFSDSILDNKIIQNSKKTVEEFSPSLIAKKYYEIFVNL